MKNNEIFELMEQLFIQAKMRFGNAVRGRWFYDRDGCPGCGKKVKAMKWKGENALSLNAYIFREHGVLIGYLLCGKCARDVFKLAETHPTGTTELHSKIEENLKKAFVSHLGH